MNSSDLKNLLTQKLSQASYAVTEAAQDQLVNYLLLLEKWNQAYNLTSVRDIKEMVVQHILDSLSVAEFINGKRILDVGTGAGLPGIPLALTQSDREFVLLDSNGKKTRFLTHVIQTLNIKNVKVVQARVEELQSENYFDVIISRAFSAIVDFLEKTKHLCCDEGVFLAMKGNYPEQELKEIGKEFKVLKTYELKIVGLNAQRHLVVIKRENH